MPPLSRLAVVALAFLHAPTPSRAAEPTRPSPTSTETPTSTQPAAPPSVPAEPVPPPPPTAPPPPAGAPAPLPRSYFVERVEIRGLAHTRADEVRRHLLVAPGDVLDTDRVVLSRLRLLQLGWFSRVETHVERGSEKGLVVLVVDVVERNTLIVTDLIIGSTGPQPIYGGLGLSQQNFLGRGMGLSGAFVFGGSPIGRPDDPSRFALRGGFFEPDLTLPGGLPPLVIGASGLFLRGEELSCGDPDCDRYADDFGSAPRLRYQRAGGELQVGLRSGPFTRVLAAYRYERLHAEGEDLVLGPGADAPPIIPGWSNLSALVGTWDVDTRDDFFYPTDGVRALAQVTFGSKVLGGDYEFSRYVLQLETAFGLLKLPLRFQAALGAAQGDAPFFERFYAADWSYFAVGPALGRALELNFSTDSRYDAFLAMGGLEWGERLWSRGRFFQRGYVAFGVRGVYSTQSIGGKRTDFSHVPVSADVALRLDTPVGTFNVSLGYAVDNFL
jgi:outer membrane protein insertion porin family